MRGEHGGLKGREVGVGGGLGNSRVGATAPVGVGGNSGGGGGCQQ